MQGIKIAVYESLKDITGQQSTHDQLEQLISRYSCESVLWVCSHISIGLRLFNGGTPDWEAYSNLLDHFFSSSLALRFKLGFWSQEPRRFVFHRRQLLTLAKLAIQHCGQSGKDAGDPRNEFAIAFLMMNDHLHLGLISSEKMSTSSKEGLAAYIAELLLTQEFGGHIEAGPIIRSYKMFVEIPPKLVGHPDYIDLDASLLESSGLSYREMFSINLGFISRYMTLKASDLQNDGRLLATLPGYLSALQIAPAKISHFLDIVTISPISLGRLIEQEPSHHNDLTIFRKFPLLYRWFDVGTTNTRLGFIPLDIELWMQKIYSAPFWFLFGKHRAKFSRFWGAVFEEYVHALLESVHAQPDRKYIPNPTVPNDPNAELCDGIIVHDDTLILLEYKAVLIRADTKYGGEVTPLIAHLEDKFVRERVTRAPKAAIQLGSAAKRLFGENRPNVPWRDLSTIKKCYMLIVTLDNIGSTVGMSTFLETYMASFLDRATCRGVEIKPLFCIDIETLEKIIPSLTKISLAQVLDRWHTLNPSLFTPLSAIAMHDLITPRSEGAWQEWSAVMDVVKRELFDPETIARGELMVQGGDPNI